MELITTGGSAGLLLTDMMSQTAVCSVIRGSGMLWNDLFFCRTPSEVDAIFHSLSGLLVIAGAIAITRGVQKKGHLISEPRPNQSVD